MRRKQNKTKQNKLTDKEKPMSKCSVIDCKKRTILVVGDCKYCAKSFCSMHRLPEDHKCEKMDDCKAKHFQKNETSLLQGKLVMSKV